MSRPLRGLLALVSITACQGSTVTELTPDAGTPIEAGSDAPEDNPGAKDWTLVYEDPNAGPDDALHTMWAAAENAVWAVGKNRQTVHFDGKKWSSLAPIPGAHLYDIWGASASEIVTVGINAFDTSPAVFNFNGDLWTSGAPFPPTVTGLTGVWGTGTQRYFTGLEGHIFQDDPVVHPTDRYHLASITGGCPNVDDPAPDLNGIDASDLENILVVGNNGLLSQRDSTGWARFCSPDTSIHYSAVFRIPGSKNFYIGSNHLGILVWIGRGEPLIQLYQNFELPDADEAFVQSISGDAGHMFAVGHHGKILYFSSKLEDVMELSSPTSDHLYGVVWVQPGTLYICGTGNRIWRRDAPLP